MDVSILDSSSYDEYVEEEEDCRNSILSKLKDLIIGSPQQSATNNVEPDTADTFVKEILPSLIESTEEVDEQIDNSLSAIIRSIMLITIPSVFNLFIDEFVNKINMIYIGN